ncbi:MAG TPA: subclass B3 metallo-beta-lactamase, partial [Pseudoxanthomonas sp.]
DYRRSFDAVRGLACDVLITPHPDASGWDPAMTGTPLKAATTCRDYADRASRKLDEQLKSEHKSP